MKIERYQSIINIYLKYNAIHVSDYIYIYIHTHIHMIEYVERERERKNMYIYRVRDREREDGQRYGKNIYKLQIRFLT